MLYKLTMIEEVMWKDKLTDEEISERQGEL